MESYTITLLPAPCCISDLDIPDQSLNLTEVSGAVNVLQHTGVGLSPESEFNLIQ